MKRWQSYLYLALPALIFSCSDDADFAPRPTRRASAPAQATDPPPSAAAGLPDGMATLDAAQVLARAREPGRRGLIVSCWASWCGSCREEIPMLLKLRADLAPEGVELLFVSVDQPKDFEAAVKLMRSVGGPLPAFALAPGTLGAFKRAMSANWRGGIPATFLFDGTAKLRHLWEGPILEHEIAPVVQGFLAGAAIDGETRTAAEAR